MAFILDDLDRLMENPAKGPSLYTYKTRDALDTNAGNVLSVGYFNDLIPYLPLGVNTPNEDMPVILCMQVDAENKVTAATFYSIRGNPPNIQALRQSAWT